MNTFKRVYRFIKQCYFAGSIFDIFPEWRGREVNQIFDDYCDLFTGRIASDEIDRIKHLEACQKAGIQPNPWKPLPRPSLYLGILNFRAEKPKSYYVLRDVIESQKSVLLLTEIIQKDEIFEATTKTSGAILDKVQKLEDQFIATLPEHRKN
jgi:hypothetical protein